MCRGMKRKTFFGNNWFLGLNVSITVLGNVETDLFLVLWSGPSQRNPLGVMTHNYDTQHPDHSTDTWNSTFDTKNFTFDTANSQQTLLLTLQNLLLILQTLLLTLQTLLLTIKLYICCNFFCIWQFKLYFVTTNSIFDPASSTFYIMQCYLCNLKWILYTLRCGKLLKRRQKDILPIYYNSKKLMI